MMRVLLNLREKNKITLTLLWLGVGASAYCFSSAISFAENAQDIQSDNVTMTESCQHDEPTSTLLEEVQLQVDRGDSVNALKRLKTLEDANDPEAIFATGVLYLNGCFNNGIRNPREATIYFARSAALGYVPGLTALADSFLNGDGAIKSEPYAFKLYKQAADKGDGIAQFNLAVLYRDGIGTKVSKKRALYYFKKAAKNPYLADLTDVAQQLHDELKSGK